ncbi:MAG: GDP-mannose 4,6-dehydratase [Actinobacteria bacterium]|nr:GDP-mannose 4,6-dehydratase [Actinomycetota bacterium]
MSKKTINKKVLITGGAGFIGSHLTEFFLAKGYAVLVLDNFFSGKREYLPKDNNLTIVKGDILDFKLMQKEIVNFNPSIVYHLAAMHYIPLCNLKPYLTIRVNVVGVNNLLTICEKLKLKSLVFASTGAIYKEQQANLTEESAIEPQDIYSITKYTAEYLVKLYYQKTKQNVIIARLFNVFGPRETNPHILPSIIEQIQKGSKIIKIGNLHTKRDYIHVEDVVRALYLIGTKKLDDFEVFNIGFGKERSVMDIIKICKTITKKDLKIVQLQSLVRSQDRISQLANITKIKKKLKWIPRQTIETYLNHVLT